jgi:AraC-like DNA-binding protein
MRKSATDHTRSVRVGSSFALPEIVRSLGQSPETVFATAGVDPELYRDPENRIDASDLGRLFLSAADATGRQDIALLVTSGFRPQGLGIVGLLAAEGPDVRTALRNLVRMLRYNTLAGYPVLSGNGDVAMMKFELRYADFPGAEFILEGATGIILRFMQWLCGRPWQPEEVHLSRREPADPRPFRAFFGAPVRFSSTENGVVFAADWLDRRLDREERRLRQMKFEAGAAPFSELVRRQVAIDLGFEPLTGARMASQLGISRRQLFRHLAAESTTYQSLVDDVRFSRARYLLSAGDAPIAEIAFAVGYPDQSSFTRAFARWSGATPGEWRRHPGPEIDP